MLKRTIALFICLILLCVPVFAEDEATFEGSVKNGENIEITVTAPTSFGVRAFVYTYTVSGAGHCLLHQVDMIGISSGETKKLVITPPEEGYKKKLVVAERFTLKPLCKSYEYPYMVNVYAESLGYKLTNVGTETHNGKTYASNTFDITEFMQGETEAEVSVLSLMLAASK